MMLEKFVNKLLKIDILHIVIFSSLCVYWLYLEVGSELSEEADRRTVLEIAVQVLLIKTVY